MGGGTIRPATIKSVRMAPAAHTVVVLLTARFLLHTAGKEHPSAAFTRG